MYISKFRVINYKSYGKPNELEFKPGFNIIAGQNNVGKTALLEALSLSFQSRPHRSLATIPIEGINPSDVASQCEITFVVSREELFNIIRSSPKLREVRIPTPVGTPAFQNTDEKLRFLDSLTTRIFSNETLDLTLKVSREGENNIAYDLLRYPSFGLYEAIQEQGSAHYLKMSYDFESNIWKDMGDNIEPVGQGDFGFTVAQILASRIYSFKADRLRIGSSGFGTNTVLNSGAGNLAEVLANLQSSGYLFSEYFRCVQQVLPNVKQISVKSISNTAQRIFVWTVEPKLMRDDLGIPLEECGTGVSQVLALLYVAVASKYPQTILIDEPQSFLHPGAVRKLVEVLKQYQQHQYILATHSPGIISATRPQTFTLVKQENSVSSFDVIDAKNTKQLSLYLAEVGARLSDVFGADNILWVEGRTEEQAFPLILEKVANRSLMGTAIVGFVNTGDLESKDVDRVLEIYDRLSKANALLPPAIGFIFDREDRTKEQREILKKRIRNERGESLIHFIPRRLFENYLLNPDAIAALLNNILGQAEQEYRPRNPDVSRTEIIQWLEANLTKEKYGKAVEAGEDWIYYSRGDVILDDIFREFLKGLAHYKTNKVEFSYRLTEWAIENSPEDFAELVEFLTSTFDQANR